MGTLLVTFYCAHGVDFGNFEQLLESLQEVFSPPKRQFYDGPVVDCPVYPDKIAALHRAHPFLTHVRIARDA